MLCGRKGSRRFVLLMGTTEYVCTSQRACQQRRDRWLRAFRPRRKRAAA
jgi:hypothetical protein